MRIFFYLLILIVILLGISFAILNAETVKFNYYMGTVQMPLSILLVSSMIIGMVLGWVLSLKTLIRSKRKNFSLKSQLSKVKKG